MKNGILLLLIFFLFNCSKQENNIIKKKQNSEFDFSNIELQENLNKAILKGDTLAYIKSYKTYTTNNKGKEFLYYAIVMAEKNNYKRAYYDISRLLALRTDDPLIVKYNYSSSFGLYSFLKSYELGDKFAKDDVKDFYINQNKPIPKSSSIYCKE